jgi:CBS domain-containing protein
MVTDRDIVLRAVAEDADMGTYTARQVMSPNILCCFDDQSFEEVLRNMSENQVRRFAGVKSCQALDRYDFARGSGSA